MSSGQHPVAFVDLETTGLDARLHEAWEFAVIRRDNGRDVEHLWQLRPARIEHATAEALRVSGFTERFAVPKGFNAARIHPDRPVEGVSALDLVTGLRAVLTGASVVASNPRFDMGFLAALLTDEPWAYRPMCVANLAAGWLAGRGMPQAPPWRSHELSELVGVPAPGEGVAHTALGDARWCRDLYDAVMTG